MPVQRDKPPVEPTLDLHSDLMAENIQAMADIVARREARLPRGQRAIESFTNAIGRPRFLYINAALMLLWIALNTRTGHPMDPSPFSGLALLVGVESLFVTGLILMTQNRQGAEMDRRAHLDLQINLLSEREITKMLSLLEDFVRLHHPEREHDPELAAMKETADPEIMLNALDHAMDKASASVNQSASEDDPSNTSPMDAPV
ncbi:MAG TPA: DUF1003 domain-containing protein [Armatimonadota bacterium]|jgi:uncharacterized membrane protein